MSSDIQEYFVVFDTNVLYHAYDKKADFSSFSFNSTFENIIGFVNQLDIYEHVVMLVPTVVWMEMERQIIEAHQLKLKEFREKTAKQCLSEIFCENWQNPVKQRITPHFLTTRHSNYYEFTTKE